MNYIAFYKGKRVEIHADTLINARNKVAAQLKVPAKKHYEINIMLAKKNGEQVTHVADF